MNEGKYKCTWCGRSWKLSEVREDVVKLYLWRYETMEYECEECREARIRRENGKWGWRDTT